MIFQKIEKLSSFPSDNILIHAEKADCLESGIELIEECGGLDKIEALQNSPNDAIYGSAYRMIDTYFNDSDDEAEIITPAVGENGEFIFENDGAAEEKEDFKF